ncbi:hypothetical protein SRABI133_03644 [Peribacillus simplex]|uniref:Uncharacterized protein n=1 Tax=Peribacillus simplex TaxID=1478 RepID=A0A9W4L1T2_9BACI|nr:hypothetical protein SRABI133_03644 [Peribacillus simplex]
MQLEGPTKKADDSGRTKKTLKRRSHFSAIKKIFEYELNKELTLRAW